MVTWTGARADHRDLGDEVLARQLPVALIIFSKVHIPKTTADMFETLALSVKMAVLPFVYGPVFR